MGIHKYIFSYNSNIFRDYVIIKVFRYNSRWQVDLEVRVVFLLNFIIKTHSIFFLKHILRFFVNSNIVIYDK